ncbi:protein shisa-5-like [Echeneis naucrates]|uniref:protein shisa-5-like n=1 Tax=Echeneis naucrates TaxID=173247 RepID=UPI001113CB30|nr:protein shisa-5-like [Echeneis naucrates]
MISRLLYNFGCVLCVILLPAVWAEDCRDFTERGSSYREPLKCGPQYCCEKRGKIYCCSEEENRVFYQEEGHFERLSVRSTFPPIIFILIGIIVICIIVVLIVCFACPCCLLYKQCQKRHNGTRQAVVTTTVIGTSQLPLSPSGYHPSYQPVPAPHGQGGPTPPSYLEATYSAVPYPQQQPMYPVPPPGQNYHLPPLSDEFVQLPYNPAYGPDP